MLQSLKNGKKNLANIRKILYNYNVIRDYDHSLRFNVGVIQPKPPEGCRKASIFVVLRGFLINLIERHPSFTHQIDGLDKFNIVYSEDFSLKSFSNVSKNLGTFARSFLNI